MMQPQTKIEAIRKTVMVDAPVEKAFRVFTQGIAAWWPLRTKSVGRERTTSAAFEERVGGRLYERAANGDETVWGTISVWEPPHRIVYTWHPGRGEETSQEVEMRFVPEGSRTRIDFEHRGWERLGERGAEARREYDGGWDEVFALYTEAARK